MMMIIVFDIKFNHNVYNRFLYIFSKIHDGIANTILMNLLFLVNKKLLLLTSSINI